MTGAVARFETDGRWRWLLLATPHLAVTLLVLAFVHLRFLRASLHADLGLGELGAPYTLDNFIRILADPVYLRSLQITLGLPAAAVAISTVAAFPAAYILARMPNRGATLVMTAILGSSFVSLAIKILGMIILFAQNGPINRFLLWTGLSRHGVHIIGTLPSVLFGYLHLSIPFALVMIYAVLVTIPRRLEEAALAHGASPLQVFTSVLLPLSLPGVVNAALTQFNLLSGLFVTAAILGGGRILTLPLFIQRTLTMFNDYGMASALSAVLVALVVIVNFGASAVTWRLATRLP